MTRFRITETVVYDVEADTPLDAYEKVFNTDGGLVEHFMEVPNRTIEKFDEDRGIFQPEDEPADWNG
jgi:hypothetical protein